jgi:hypothetical protein
MKAEATGKLATAKIIVKNTGSYIYYLNGDIIVIKIYPTTQHTVTIKPLPIPIKSFVVL